MNQLDEIIARTTLSRIVRLGASDEAIRLVAQLLNVAPCPQCDYRKEFCRCSKASWFRSQ